MHFLHPAKVQEVPEVRVENPLNNYIYMKRILSILNIILHALQTVFGGQQDSGSRSRHKGTTDKKLIASGVKRFFMEHYELRYNVMKQTEEFRPRQKRSTAWTNSAAASENSAAPPEKSAAASEESAAAPENSAAAPEKSAAAPEKSAAAPQKDGEGWQQLTDRDLRAIAFEQMEEVGVAWSIDVELYVRSALTPQYSPVADFLGHLPPWDGQTDHIGQLARRVPTDYEAWPDLFHRWFLGMVAQWQQRSRDYGNAIVPLLIGGQGTHKSTFCKQLLPHHLREYYIDDIKLDNAEQVERMLSRMLLVNIDEYNAKTDREQAKIKRVLTERDVQTRKMRSDQYLMLPRMASFIATTNDRQPLTDPSGSRRYLCCEVNGIIDTSAPIDYGALYAQAVGELQQGATWYFTKDEEEAVSRHNEQYTIQQTPEMIVETYYEPAPRSKDCFLSATDIQQQLSKQVRKADLPSLIALGRALRRLGFQYGAIDGRHGWYAQRR